ncbi:uncharacterized protein LOC106458062 [Limulus polyphemus]|uniref:Uncharacterized protein LOC106458062 n=1 Tax=Limulus polyphemus TaxID=6850 RepID=A0ABM1B1M5_LIMPO|nr:uncharacterized protein LOC106458062 [Limulus polyphemus]
MFFNYVYVRLLLVTLLYTVSLHSPDCASHTLEKRQAFQRRSRPAFRSPGRVKINPESPQLTTTTEEPSDYYYDDYYDYYPDYYLRTTTTTTTTTTPRPRPLLRRRRPFRRGRGPGRFRRPVFRKRPAIPEGPRNVPVPVVAKTEAPTTTTTTLPPTTTKPRRHYPPREDGRYIDYLSDPNLPRELNGVDLNNYPFFITLPEDIDFNCDGRHDGYYSSVPHKCQLFHWCFGSQRFDFLCPNYTLYDQTTFTCRFVNKVDCENSELHYNRNDELYVETTTLSEEEQREERRKKKRKSKSRRRSRNRSRNRSKKREEEEEEENEDEDDYEDEDYDDEYYDDEDEKKK